MRNWLAFNDQRFAPFLPLKTPFKYRLWVYRISPPNSFASKTSNHRQTNASSDTWGLTAARPAQHKAEYVLPPSYVFVVSIYMLGTGETMFSTSSLLLDLYIPSSSTGHYPCQQLYFRQNLTHPNVRVHPHQSASWITRLPRSHHPTFQQTFKFRNWHWARVLCNP